MSGRALTKAEIAQYPFLPKAKQYIAGLGIDLKELSSVEEIVNRAEERVKATFEFTNYYLQNARKDSEIEIASFPVAVIIVSSINDTTLTNRFVLSEAKQMYESLRSITNAGLQDEMIHNIAGFFQWKINRSKILPYEYTVHLVDYLNNVSRGRLVHDPKWKLVNRQVDKGQVYLTRTESCRLLQEEIRKYIEDRTKEKISKIPQIVQKVIERVKEEFFKMKPHLTEFDQVIRAEESEYPPCIKNLLDRTIKGQHLSHVERFTLVTYLLHQGVTTEGVINLFANTADFREDKTRYQVEHLAGQRGSRTAYRTYNCSTLQTHGVCTNPNQPICQTIRNPLSFHLRKKSKKKPTK